MPAPIAESALQEIYRRRGARLEERGGWLVPAAFGPVEAEIVAARTAIAIGEWIDLGTLELEGTDLQDHSVRLGVGGVAVRTAAPLALAGVDRARWCRLTRDRARVLVTAGEEVGRPALPEAGRSTDGSPIHGGLFPVATAFRPWLARTAEALTRHLEREGETAATLAGSKPCLHLADLSSGLTTLQVLGPRSPDLLARLVRIDPDPRVFRDHTLALTGAVGIPLQLLRWDWGTILAFELTIGRDVAAYFWDALTHAGDDLGLAPIGAEALSRLRAEHSGPGPELEA